LLASTSLLADLVLQRILVLFSQHPNFSSAKMPHLGMNFPMFFFSRDLAKLYEVLETARNPSRLLMAKLEEMEDGQFVPGRKHGNWEPLINRNPEGFEFEH